MSKQGQKKCKRNGCQKQYTDQQNTQGACQYHPGKPIFHDLKKGWACCNKIVYDWDEFEKIPKCATGKHTDVKEQATQFFKSNTVQHAANAIKKQQSKNVVIKDINQYNKEQQQKKKVEQKPTVEKKEVITKEGKFKCINKGCLKDYLDSENNQQACKYHKGSPVFHDLKKYWTCCGKQTYDFDDFMKLPTCSVGWHSPKMA